MSEIEEAATETIDSESGNVSHLLVFRLREGSLRNSDYRTGRAPLRTATELALLLPVPLLLIQRGQASPRFPVGAGTGPSSFVAVVLNRVVKNRVSVFPQYVHWKQWQDVVAPLLQDQVLNGWRGIDTSIGDLLALLNNVIGPDGSVRYPAGTDAGSSLLNTDPRGKLYACDPPWDVVGGETSAYLSLLALRVSSLAVEQGY